MKKKEPFCITRTWTLGRLKIKYEHQSSNHYMGRFGGGWQWKVGFQGAERDWIFFLLVASVWVRWMRKGEQ